MAVLAAVHSASRSFLMAAIWRRSKSVKRIARQRSAARVMTGVSSADRPRENLANVSRQVNANGLQSTGKENPLIQCDTRIVIPLLCYF